MKNIFKKLFEKPIGLMTFFYLIVFVSVLGLGLYYISNNHSIVQNTFPPKLTDTLGIVKELAIIEPKISAAVDMSAFTNPSQATLEKGKQLYVSICAACHGPEGKGDGPAGMALNPKPRNFHDTEGWKNGRKSAELYTTLQKGILQSGMPGYDYMPAADRVAIISYIRTLMTAPPSDTQEELNKLDQTYGLSAGIKQAGQIPVASAMKFFISDYSANEMKINDGLQKISDPVNEAQFELFSSVIENYRSALTTVINTPESLGNAQSFQSVIFANAGHNGFSASVLRLSDKEITSLFTLIKNVLS
ncbi:MAG: hypothetical protein AMXMBFR48_05930 [Ignavibacteriales bacterium]